MTSWLPVSAGALIAAGVALLGLVLGFAALYWRQRRLGRRLAASLDALTTRFNERLVDLPGVIDRPAFDDALDAAATRCDRAGTQVTVLFVGVDSFVLAGDAPGFDGDDEQVEMLARRLVDAAGPQVAITWLGGEEFLLLLPEGPAVAAELARRLLATMTRPVPAGAPRPVVASCSIGIATYPQHGAWSRLARHAGMAARSVELAGGGAFTVFDPRMAVDTREQAELVHDLRQAVANGELELYYQPKVDARSLQITAAEALLRWHHPVRGAVSPAVFVPLAERHGLIDALGQWVIEEACRQAAEWRDGGLRMRVAINVSACQMRQEDLVDHIVATLRTHGLPPARFTCEITETVAMEDTAVTQRSFEKMRRAGLHVSIDDFGVGQSSLSYLRRLPAAELKVDASFVRDLASSADARSIVDAVVRLAHALQLRVVAEGVETAAQRDLLVAMGCDELQGYLFARPMQPVALALWAVVDHDRPEASLFRPSLFQDTAPAIE